MPLVVFAGIAEQDYLAEWHRHLWFFGSAAVIFSVVVIGLILFIKGTLTIIESVAMKHVNDLWWLGLIVGIFEILLGLWASQRNRYAWIEWTGSQWPAEPPLDSAIEWGFCSSAQ